MLCILLFSVQGSSRQNTVFENLQRKNPHRAPVRNATVAVPGVDHHTQTACDELLVPARRHLTNRPENRGQSEGFGRIRVI